MSKTEKVLEYQKALPLSAVLGKCTIKSAGSDLFFPIVKLKADLNNAQVSFEALQKGIMSDAGVTVNADGSISAATPMPVVNQIQEAMKALGACDSGVKNWELLTKEKLTELHAENPALTTADLAELLIMLKD